MLQVNSTLRTLSLSGRQTLDTVSQQMMGLGATVARGGELSVRDLSLITDGLRTNRGLTTLVRSSAADHKLVTPPPLSQHIAHTYTRTHTGGACRVAHSVLPP